MSGATQYTDKANKVRISSGRNNTYTILVSATLEPPTVVSRQASDYRGAVVLGEVPTRKRRKRMKTGDIKKIRKPYSSNTTRDSALFFFLICIIYHSQSLSVRYALLRRV